MKYSALSQHQSNIYSRMRLYIILLMLQRSKSFSKGGSNIDRVIEIEKYKIDSLVLKKMLAPKLHISTHNHKHNHKHNHHEQVQEGITEEQQQSAFDKVTGRDKLSPFLLFNIKDANTHLDYAECKEKVMTRTVLLPVRREKDERLSGMFGRAKETQAEEENKIVRRANSCKRYEECSHEDIKTVRDLSARRTFHNIDFKKQTNRPFQQTLKKLSQPEFKPDASLRSSSSQQGHLDKYHFDKTAKVHSFASYTSRDFLSNNKVRGAPQASGIDWFRINPEKFKANWKTISARPFEKGGVVRLSKHDRDCPHWFTQLNYNVLNKQQKGSTGHIQFLKQTNRKDNVVKSAYPIRIAI